MTHLHRIAALLAAVVLTACADGAPTAAAPLAVGVLRDVSTACSGIDGDGCTPVSDVFDIASIDVGDSYIQSTTGRRYIVSFATIFLPIALPPNPIFPNDPLYGTVTSWNALVESRGSYRAFLAQLRLLPPNPVLPPNPIRLSAEALTDGTNYYLQSLQPVLAQ